jgi:hypothetical protein
MKPTHKVTFIKLSCKPKTPRENMLNLKYVFYCFTQLLLQICFFPEIYSKLTQYMCSETNARIHVNCLLTFYCNNRNWSYSKNFRKTLQFLENVSILLELLRTEGETGKRKDRQILLGTLQWYVHARTALQITWKVKDGRTKKCWMGVTLNVFSLHEEILYYLTFVFDELVALPQAYFFYHKRLSTLTISDKCLRNGSTSE